MSPLLAQLFEVNTTCDDVLSIHELFGFLLPLRILEILKHVFEAAGFTCQGLRLSFRLETIAISFN